MIQYKMLTLFTFTFAKTHQEVLNANHFGSVSDSLGRLAAASQRIASLTNGGNSWVELSLFGA